MSKYTLTDSELISFNADGKGVYKVGIVVDTESDIPKPDDTWYPGSMCQIAGTHKYKVLNNEREWK